MDGPRLHGKASGVAPKTVTNWSSDSIGQAFVRLTGGEATMSHNNAMAIGKYGEGVRVPTAFFSLFLPLGYCEINN